MHFILSFSPPTIWDSAPPESGSSGAWVDVCAEFMEVLPVRKSSLLQELHEVLSKAHPRLQDVKRLVEDSNDPDSLLLATGTGEKTALHLACGQCESIDPQIVDYLISVCPKVVRCKNSGGCSPLQVALLAKKNHNPNIIQTLYDADPTTVLIGNREMTLPLHSYLTFPRSPVLAVVQILCPLSSDEAKRITEEQLRMCDAYGQNALHKAASNRKCSAEVIRYLIDIFPPATTAMDKNGFVEYLW